MPRIRPPRPSKLALNVGIMTAALLVLTTVAVFAVTGGTPQRAAQPAAVDETIAPSSDPSRPDVTRDAHEETAATGPGLSISCSPGRFPAGENNGGRNDCKVRSIGGFAGRVDLSCEQLPHGLWCDFAPAQVEVPSGGQASTVLQLRPDDVPPGSYRFLVVAQGEGTRGSFSFPFKIEGGSGGPAAYVVVCNDSMQIPMGNSRTQQCRVESHHGLNTPVTLTCRSPDGLSCSISPSTVTPAAYGVPAIITLSVGSPLNQRAGQYTVFIEGRNSQWSYPGAAELVQAFVVQPSIRLTCDDQTLTSSEGRSVTTCRAHSVDGFDQEVRFSCPSAEPSSCAFSPASASVPDGGTATTTLTISTQGLEPGTYDYLVDARGPWRSEVFALKVVVP